MTDILIRFFVKDYKNTSDQAVRKRYGIFAGIVGMLCNVLLFASKLIAGLISGSISITADAFNNLSDAGSSIVTLIGFKLASRPPDREHPFGHGRIEYVSGLIVSIIIILCGLELLKASGENIFNPQRIEFNTISIIILIVSIAVKFWLFLFNRHINKKISSKVMKANSIDCISDVITTASVLVGIFIYLFTGLNLDAYIGCLVAIFIIYTGFATARDTLSPLLGEPPSSEFVKEIQNKVLSYENIIGVHDLIVHNYGPGRVIISLHAEVPCDMDILKIHDTVDVIERDLKARFGCEAVIHMDPVAVNDEVSNNLKCKIEALLKLLDKSICIHDFRMVEDENSTKLIFDIVVPHKFRLSDQEIITSVENALKAIDDTYELIINVDKALVPMDYEKNK